MAEKDSHVSGQPAPTGGDLTLDQVNEIKRREDERIRAWQKQHVMRNG